MRTREFSLFLASWSLVSTYGENDQSAEAGTFSDAAVNVELPVSAISRLLIRLEKHLDLLLVCRNQRGLALTDAGRNISYPVKEPCSSCARDASFSINIVPVHPAFRVPTPLRRVYEVNGRTGASKMGTAISLQLAGA